MADYNYPLLGNSPFRISSGIGARTSPGGIGSTNHAGTDIAVPVGTGVVAPISGVIQRAGAAGGFGNLIQLKGADGLTYKLGHLSSVGVSVGDVVNAGQYIGASGNTGHSTGPHLHFEVRNAAGGVVNGSAILKQGKQLVSAGGSAVKNAAIGALKAAALSNPITAPLAIGADLLGIGGGKSWLDQLKDWIASTGFFQRLALAILAFIILAAALALMKGNLIQQVRQRVKG
jgi:murein DD-endopeptidase MepM/ murein hydrolase activator NlpD